VNPLSVRCLRASPDYELVLFDRLTEHERSVLAELRREPDFYGILRPRHDGGASHLPVRAVDRETALLILTLREPGPLPSYALERDPSARGIAQLVLDRVLEVQEGAEFVSGPAATRLVRTAEKTGASGRLAQISLDAISAAVALDADDRETLARWLYAYNRLPFSASHSRRYPDASAILALVGDDGTLRVREWAVTGGHGGDWISLSRRSGYRPAGRSRPPDGPTYKLYVSPGMDALPDACRALRETLERHRVRHFKLAGSAAGLLRPDKLVAYFDDAPALAAVAEALRERLRGASAQGVPFTASIDPDGLLSWGVDPPPRERPLSWLPQQSWRGWVTSTLAGGLVHARREPGAPGAARFALTRLALEGVDVERWMPEQRLWHDARAGVA